MGPGQGGHHSCGHSRRAASGVPFASPLSHPVPRCSPLHTCKACGGYADDSPDDGKPLELVPCRRCPVAYHRRCLPGDLPRCREHGRKGARVWLADYDEQQGESWCVCVCFVCEGV